MNKMPEKKYTYMRIIFFLLISNIYNVIHKYTVSLYHNTLVWLDSSPCINPLVTVPGAPIKIGMTVTLIFHSFFSSLARFRYYPSFLFLSILLCGQPGHRSPQFGKFSFLMTFIGLVVWPR